MSDGERISALEHTHVPIKNGGEVIVINTGAVLTAEHVAMLQAIHSRSTGGLRAHLEKLIEKGSARFMEETYVGYGHSSIGDCGDTTAFTEGVSMLVAKAEQDDQLYNGQEASTRYIDFSRQPFMDPTNSSPGRDLLEMQRTMYLLAQEPTRELLRKRHPKAPEEDDKKYDKAIKARAFDITRGLLPAGASTNLAWHTTLRRASDRLLFLRHHPLEEVRETAGSLEEALKKHHPHSFGHKRYPETEKYQDLIAAQYYFHDTDSPLAPVVDFRAIDRIELEKFRELLDKRPKKTEIPKYVGQAGDIVARFQLDFGSFRDLQRHRAILQRMPLLTTDLGFESWYVDNLPPEVTDRLPGHLNSIKEGIRDLGVSPLYAQYFVPMGYKVSNRFKGDIPASVYMVELRDSSLVHPTLQRVAHNIGEQISRELNIPLHVDPNPGRFNVKRGEHDIEFK